MASQWLYISLCLSYMIGQWIFQWCLISYKNYQHILIACIAWGISLRHQRMASQNGKTKMAVERELLWRKAILSMRLIFLTNSTRLFNEIRKLNFKAWQAIWYSKPLQGSTTALSSSSWVNVLPQWLSMLRLLTKLQLSKFPSLWLSCHHPANSLLYCWWLSHFKRS